MQIGSPEPGRIAILGGTGAEGSGLALRWARAGFEVIIGSRDPARAEATAARIRQALQDAARAPAAVNQPARLEPSTELRPGPVEGRPIASSGEASAAPVPTVRGVDNAEAAAQADTMVLTVPFAAQLPTLKSVHNSLRAGQVLVDLTVPTAVAVGGRPTQLLGVWQGSAAEAAADSVPGGVAVVAALHHVSATHLSHLDQEVDCDVLVCGDQAAAKERARRLVEAIPGCRYVDAGPLANARILEAITALLIGINLRYRVRGSGIRITGLPGVGTTPPNPG